jgi:hypothetical protein
MITRVVSTDNYVEIYTKDAKVITICPHDEKIYLSVSGLAEKRLKPSQFAANTVNIYYEENK